MFTHHPTTFTFLHGNQINFNIHKNVFRDLDVDPTSDTWFTNKYIEDYIKKKVDKTRGQVASDEMEYDIRQYIDFLKHDHFCVGRITNDINKVFVNREYTDLFMQIYMQWSSDNSIECMPHFEKMALSQFKVYIEVEKMTHCYVCDNYKMIIFIQYYNVKEGVVCILQMLRIHKSL